MTKIYVKESLLHGCGLFSSKTIYRAETISMIIGSRHSHDVQNIGDAISNPDWIYEKIETFKGIDKTNINNKGIIE